MKIADLFDTSEFEHASLFQPDGEPWQPLNDLKEYMNSFAWPESPIPTGAPLTETLVLYNGACLSADGLDIIFEDVTKGRLKVSKNGSEMPGASILMAGAIFLSKQLSIGKGVLVESGALLKGMNIIGDCCEVRQAAYLRGYCLAGKRCVLGHATEIKHSIFLNDAKAGHFAYLGDSILGGNANLGAGTKFANLRFLPGNVSIRVDGKLVDTGRRKLGAILGDGAQTGCNSVTSPGVVMGKHSALLPNTTAKAGFHKAKAILR